MLLNVVDFDVASPLLSRLVARRLHVLPHPRRVVAACADQLSPAPLARFVREMEQRARDPARDDGYFELLPREVILNIFSYLDLGSLVRAARVCSTWRHVARDLWLYTRVDLRQLFHCVTTTALAWLESVAAKLSCLDLSWCGNYGSLSPASLASLVAAVSPSLQQLSLDNCHIATGAVLTAIGSHCRQLTHISLANCHLLKPQHFQALAPLETLVSLGPPSSTPASSLSSATTGACRTSPWPPAATSPGTRCAWCWPTASRGCAVSTCGAARASRAAAWPPSPPAARCWRTSTWAGASTCRPAPAPSSPSPSTAAASGGSSSPRTGKLETGS